ncbi:MAG: gamma-glutamylcyclotransferase family protein [Verrucomicrobiota bacterium]
MHLLFVYGSLKRGFSNHFFLLEAQWVGEANTESSYRMFDYGGFPAVIRDEEQGYSIRGELWKIDDTCLSQIDVLEGVDSGLYERSTTLLEVPWDQKEDVIMYLYLQTTKGLPDVGGQWPKSLDLGDPG